MLRITRQPSQNLLWHLFQASLPTRTCGLCLFIRERHWGIGAGSPYSSAQGRFWSFFKWLLWSGLTWSRTFLVWRLYYLADDFTQLLLLFFKVCEVVFCLGIYPRLELLRNAGSTFQRIVKAILNLESRTILKLFGNLGPFWTVFVEKFKQFDVFSLLKWRCDDGRV